MDDINTSPIISPTNKNAKSAAVGSWQSLMWETFDGGSFTNKWELVDRNDYNSQICRYSSSVPFKGNQDGLSCLVINATKTGNSYQSGMIKSLQKFKPENNTEYIFYSKIKLIALNGTNDWKPFSQTYGAWPAFWTVEETAWPTKGEIDVMEAYSYGNSDRFASNLFFGTSAGNNTLGTAAERVYNPTPTNWSWNNYDMYWKNENGVNTITIKLNNQVISTYTGGYLNDFGPHNVLLNLNVGSDGGIFNNSQINLFSKTMMWVDYVGVSKRTI